MKFVSTDHKQANNLASLITCFLSNGYFISSAYGKTIIIFDLFLFREFLFLFLLIPGTILMLDERLVFLFWLCNVYTYLYKKRFPHYSKYNIYIYVRRPNKPANTDHGKLNKGGSKILTIRDECKITRTF